MTDYTWLQANHDPRHDKALQALRAFFLPRWQEKHALYQKYNLRVLGGPLSVPEKSMCKYTSVFLETALPAMGLMDADLVMGDVVGHDGQRYSHHWIVSDDMLVDLTGAQFGTPEILHVPVANNPFFHAFPPSSGVEGELLAARDNVDETVTHWLNDFFHTFTLS